MNAVNAKYPNDQIETALYAIAQNRQRASVGLSIFEAAPEMPTPNPLSMPLAKAHVELFRLKGAVRRGLRWTVVFTLPAFFWAVFADRAYLIGALLWVISTSSFAMLWMLRVRKEVR